ncbi:hypothetical protein AC623_17410 [Bacillus sp. FJAT-27231]|uniref:hypothetical protein n=1 Tax=Bacillus sp. FJAT-27231 TaxID=1679168 RepID=UPI00067174CD|nr:hypothetical protein [Bacillus sp. FJAT-27231]KMY55497.1 hypothetical protein AC623_17410 [Bacillus sp. FJAT-27231]
MGKQPLTEEQFSFVQQYVDLLTTIEEGFVYVINSFEDYSKTESDQMLSDIFAALYQVANVNETLQSIFADDIQEVIDRFETVAEQASQLNGFFNDQRMKEQVIKESLYPAFHAWAQEMEQVLAPYVRI